MANEQNLIPFTSDQSREEASKNGKKGGKASGKARRERKAMREQMELLLSLPVKQKQVKAQLKAMGINAKDLDNQMALQVAMLQSAMRGNVNAYNSIRELVGERVVEVNVNSNLDTKVKELEEYLNARTNKEVD